MYNTITESLDRALGISRLLLPASLTFNQMMHVMKDAEDAHRPPWWQFKLCALIVICSIAYAILGDHGDLLISILGFQMMLCIMLIPVICKYMHHRFETLTRMITFIMIVPLPYCSGWIYYTRFNAMWRLPQFHVFAMGPWICLLAYMDLYHRRYKPSELKGEEEKREKKEENEKQEETIVDRLVCEIADSKKATKHKRRKMKRAAPDSNNNNHIKNESSEEEYEVIPPKREVFVKSAIQRPKDGREVVYLSLYWISGDRIKYVGVLSKLQSIFESHDIHHPGAWLDTSDYGTYLVKSVEDVKHVLKSLQVALIDNPFNDKPVVYAREK